MLTAREDIKVRYGDYNLAWQYIGFSLPLIGLIGFILPAILCAKPVPLSDTADN